ncbi:HAD domain-containing protein [Undibacterium sp. SXout7W]|uniref:HAD domain-containing protein n=1 Tax=Undibacterium sp. SXout7W TaxID=3413049 RepID=UPI003BF2368F
MILFLDFDGVLHPEPCVDTGMLLCHLPLLESVLREFPSVQVVISSTWRATRTLNELRDYFSPDIADRVIGVTPNWRDLPDLLDAIGHTYVRQVEIEGWLRASGRPWEQWVAIDDKPYWFRPFLPNLVKCDSQVGLCDSVINELRARLDEITCMQI